MKEEELGQFVQQHNGEHMQPQAVPKTEQKRHARIMRQTQKRMLAYTVGEKTCNLAVGKAKCREACHKGDCPVDGNADSCVSTMKLA